MKKIFPLVLIIVIGMIIYSLYTAENINSLEGDFEELAFVRNENNTGPVHRIYAFSTVDTLWSQMEKHIDLLPHNKYGETEVYYFLKGDISENQIKLDMSGLPKKDQFSCIAHFIKDGQSRIRINKYPFK